MNESGRAENNNIDKKKGANLELAKRSVTVKLPEKISNKETVAARIKKLRDKIYKMGKHLNRESTTEAFAKFVKPFMDKWHAELESLDPVEKERVELSKILELEEEKRGYYVGEVCEFSHGKKHGYITAMYSDSSGMELFAIFDREKRLIKMAIQDFVKYIPGRDEFILLMYRESEDVRSCSLNDDLYCVIDSSGQCLVGPTTRVIRYDKKSDAYV